MDFLTFFHKSADNREVNSHKFYEFITHYNVEIIQWLIVSIVIVALLYLGLQLFGKSGEESPANTQKSKSGSSSSVMNMTPEELESKVDAMMPAQAADASVSSAPGEVQQNSAAGIASSPGGAGIPENLKQELDVKNMELTQLRSDLEKAKADGASAEDLKKKLEELESKLAEYEILEDDIADLSLFKEENARLKKELETLKGGDIAAEPSDEEQVAAEASASEEPAAEVSPEENFVAEFEEAVSGAATASADAKEDAQGIDASEEASSAAADENYVEEFEAAVQKEKQAAAATEQEPGAAPTQPKAISETQAAPTKSTKQPQQDANENSESADDILAEFAQSLEEDGDEENSPADVTQTSETSSPAQAAKPTEEREEAQAAKLTEEGEEAPAVDVDLDTDKMLAEMADLADVKEAEGSALEEELDTDKMAAEASKLISND